MKLTSTLSPSTYLTNPQYFDAGLLRVLQKQQTQIRNLQKKVASKEASLYQKKACITTLKLKYNDLRVIHHNVKQHLKDTNDTAHKIIKDMDKEIKHINQRIDGELQKSYLENTQLYDENKKLKEEIEKLKRERDKYKKMATQDSSNSSLPPSTDMFKKPVSLREPSTNKRGAQPGHTRHTSKLKTPTTIIEKTVREAPKGATPVFNNAKELQYYVTQEIDAKLVTTVTETRYFIEEKAEALPEEIMNTYKINSVTYATSFKAMVLYLNSKGTIALQRLCTMLTEMSEGKIELRAGTVVNWSQEFYEKSKVTRESILEEAVTSRVLHVDETGWKVDGKNHWMHIMCTNEVAYFVCTKKRSDEETGPLYILENYNGHLVHDGLKSYERLIHCTHNQCNVHILSNEKLEIMQS